MVTVRYQSQAVLVFQRFRFHLSLFLYHSFYSVYFSIDFNWEMLIGQKESYGDSATLRRCRVENGTELFVSEIK